MKKPREPWIISEQRQHESYGCSRLFAAASVYPFCSGATNVNASSAYRICLMLETLMTRHLVIRPCILIGSPWLHFRWRDTKWRQRRCNRGFNSFVTRPPAYFILFFRLCLSSSPFLFCSLQIRVLTRSTRMRSCFARWRDTDKALCSARVSKSHSFNCIIRKRSFSKHRHFSRFAKFLREINRTNGTKGDNPIFVTASFIDVSPY